MKKRVPILADPKEVAYYGEDPSTHDSIRRVVAKLPNDVALFCLNSCVFVSVGRACVGMVLPGRIANCYNDDNDSIAADRWLILLEEILHEDEVEATIAHEIAHAWLNHDRLGEFPEDGERQAAILAHEWGFKGRGANPEFCDSGIS